MKKEKGVTLVVLVVTIIVLLILAGVGINMALSDNGIFNKTDVAIYIMKLKDYEERIILITEEEYDKKTIDHSKEKLKILVQDRLEKENEWVDKAYTKNEDESLEENEIKVITTDSYRIVAEILDSGEIFFGEEGIDDGEPYPTIQLEQISLEGIENEKIKIKVTAQVEIKGKTKKVATIERVDNAETKSYEEGGVIFEVEKNGRYIFKATTDQGKSRSKSIYINIKGTENEITIESQPTTSRNTQKTGIQNGVQAGPIQVTIHYGDTDLQKQYKKSTDSNWTTVSENNVTFNVTENVLIVARYYDGTNAFKVQNYNIQNVDNIAPTFSSYDAAVSGATIIATGTATDTASSGATPGMAGILRYEYSINGSNYQTSNTFTITSKGTYTVYIKAIDKAGNQTVVTKSVTVTDYTVSYNMNGGSGNINSQSGIYGKIINLTTTIPTRTYYIFRGWSTSNTSTIATYQPGESYEIKENVILYAVWAKTITLTNGYLVKSSSDTGTSRSVSSEATIPAGVTVTIRMSGGGSSASGGTSAASSYIYFDNNIIQTRGGDLAYNETILYTTTKSGILKITATGFSGVITSGGVAVGGYGGDSEVQIISIVDENGEEFILQ